MTMCVIYASQHFFPLLRDFKLAQWSEQHRDTYKTNTISLSEVKKQENLRVFRSSAVYAVPAETDNHVKRSSSYTYLLTMLEN